MKNKQLVMNTYVFEELMKEGQFQIEWLEAIKNLGIDTVEIRREYLRDADELAELKAKAEELEMTLFYAVPDILFEGALMKEEKLTNYFEEYRQLGAKQFKIVAGYTDEMTDEDVNLLKSSMNDYSIHHLALENDQADYSTPEKMQVMVHNLKAAGLSVGVTFDTGNFLITGQSPLECAKVLKDDVTFVHMKNVKADTHEMTLIDEGDVPMFEVIDVFGEDVNFAIEYPCGTDPFKTVKGEIEKIKKI